MLIDIYIPQSSVDNSHPCIIRSLVNRGILEDNTHLIDISSKNLLRLLDNHWVTQGTLGHKV